MNHWWLLVILGKVVAGIVILGFTQEADMRIRMVAFLVPLDVGLIGICIGLDERELSKKQNTVINTYERPHILHMLEVLFNDIAETSTNIDRIDDSTHGSTDMLEYAYKRSRWHMDTIRLLTLQFLDSGLSNQHKELDHALIELGQVSFPNNEDSVKEIIKRLEAIMDSVVLVMNNIKKMPEL